MPPAQNFPDPRQAFDRVTRIAAAGLLAALLVAPRLWLGHDFFAPVPIAGLPEPPAALLAAAWSALLVASSAILLRPSQRALLWVALVLLLLRAGIDRMTWQPYLLQYAFLLGIAAWARGASSDEAHARSEQALAATRLALALVYFWSGIAKLDHGFLNVWSLSLFPALAELPEPWRLPAATLMPLYELVLAAALVVPRYARHALALGLSMHALLLLTLGPLGHDYNRVVWPWNLAMMALLLVLFRAPEPQHRARPAGRSRWGWPARAALVVFGLLPALGEVGLWSPSLSFRLYSARFHVGTIWVGARLRDRLPEGARASYRESPAPPHAGYLPIPWWSEQELGAFVAPEPEVYRRVFARVCARADDDPALLVIESPPDRWTGRRRLARSGCGDVAPGATPGKR